MSVRNTSAVGILLLTSVVVSHRVASSENLARPQDDPFDQYATAPTEPRVYSLAKLYEEKPTEAVSVEFRVLSTGTHHAGWYARVNDAESLPIILESTKPTGAEKGNYFQVALVGDGLTAVESLGLDSSHFSNRVVQATGVVRQVPENRQVGRRVRHEIVIDNLKHLKIVTDRHAKRQMP